MLRSAVAAYARRHLSAASSASSAGSHPTRIAELVRARGADASDALALVEPAANVRWTYGELVDRIHCFANGLNEMGYAPGQRLGVRLDNSAELLVTLMGSALSGADVETAKTAQLLAEVKCRGSVVHHSDAELAGQMLGSHEPIAVGGGALTDPVVHFDVLIEAFKGRGAPPAPEGPRGRRAKRKHARDPAGGGGPSLSSYYFSATRAVTEAELVGNGSAAAAALGMTRGKDALCISVPLAHPMGLGFGVLAAWRAGATVVLPSLAGGAAAAAEATLAAMAEERCSLMLADSHTLRALPQGLDAPPAGLEAFRGGLTKIGSGDGVGLDEPRTWAGVPLTTVGKLPAPSAA